MDESTPKDKDKVTNKRKRLLGHDNQESVLSLAGTSTNALEPEQVSNLSQTPPPDALCYQLWQLPEETWRKKLTPKPPTPSANPLFVQGQNLFQGIPTHCIDLHHGLQYLHIWDII